jgi:hypothetical protein
MATSGTQQADVLGKMLTVRECCRECKMYRKGKDIRKRRNLILKLLTFLLVTQQADELGKL